MTRCELKVRIGELRSAGLSYDKISAELGLNTSYIWRVVNRTTVVRKRASLDEVPPVLASETVRRYGSVALGCITESMACVKLVDLGFEVWRPFIDRQVSDLGVRIGTKIIRIQVKTASYDLKTRRYRCELKTRKLKGGRSGHVSYSNDDFEFFIVRCPGIEAWYVFPAEVGNAFGYVNLYPNRETLLESPINEQIEQYRETFQLLQC